MPTLDLRRTGAIAVLALVPALAAHAETLNVQRIDGAIVMGLSANGRAATGQLPGNWETFRWSRATGVVPLGRSTMDALGHRSGAPGISDDGKSISATILSDDGTYSTAGRWTEAEGWKMISVPGPADMGFVDGENSSAWALSGDGKVAAGLYWVGNDTWRAHAMRWTAATGMVDLGSSGANSRINAANRDGSVLVGWDEHPESRNWRATVWVNGVRTTLDDSGWFTEATAVSADGKIVVGQTPDPANGDQLTATMWKWNGTSWAKSYLGVMPKRPGVIASSMPLGVSDDGSVVVGQNNPDAGKPASDAFIWTPETGMQKTADWMAANGVPARPGWTTYSSGAVTPDGKVIAVTQQQRAEPWASRSLIVRRQP